MSQVFEYRIILEQVWPKANTLCLWSRSIETFWLFWHLHSFWCWHFDHAKHFQGTHLEFVFFHFRLSFQEWNLSEPRETWACIYSSVTHSPWNWVFHQRWYSLTVGWPYLIIRLISRRLIPSCWKWNMRKRVRQVWRFWHHFQDPFPCCRCLKYLRKIGSSYAARWIWVSTTSRLLRCMPLLMGLLWTKRLMQMLTPLPWRKRSLLSRKLFPPLYFPTMQTNPTGASHWAMMSRTDSSIYIFPLGLILSTQPGQTAAFH